MNVIFLTISRIKDITESGIYTDLMRKFRDEGHNVYIVWPSERRHKDKINIINADGVIYLSIKTLNLQKTNILEKGIAILLLGFLFLIAIKRHFSKVKFDLILYSTPPITFTKVIQYIKNKDGALAYLLLKDIFPQNAVDLGYIRNDGILHCLFRENEKKMYALSDYIGCMSPANVTYLLKHNPEINPHCVEVNPNSIQPAEQFIINNSKLLLRQKYKLPSDTTIFIYGGNLGKPQGIDFLIKMLDKFNGYMGVFFVIVGSGTEYNKLYKWFKKIKPNNAMLLNNIPKDEYDCLLQICDVGLIFLDKRFTIPNFPSRLLSYLTFKMPILAATDINTDIKNIIESNKFGFWSLAGDIETLQNNINILLTNKDLREKMGLNGFNYMLNNYTVSHSYHIIMKHFTYKADNAASLTSKIN